jgi:hypothetical protein
MERFASAIKQSLDNQNWYGALFISLAIPDICGNITYPELRGSGNTKHRYDKWVNTYLLPFLKNSNGEQMMTAEDYYKLRNFLLHQGVTQGITDEYRFVIKDFHLVKLGNILLINIAQFCEGVIQAIGQWSSDIKNNQEAQKQLNELSVILKGELTFYPPTIAISKNEQ